MVLPSAKDSTTVSVDNENGVHSGAGEGSSQGGESSQSNVDNSQKEGASQEAKQATDKVDEGAGNRDNKEAAKVPPLLTEEESIGGEEAKVISPNFSEFLKERGKEVQPAAKKDTSQQQQKLPATRDLSDLDPEVVPLFKQMSNEAFAKIKPIYIEYKKTQTLLAEKDRKIEELQKIGNNAQLPASYYEHPKAYTLSPEYQTKVQQAELASSVLDHWHTQLSKIRKGEDWQGLTRNSAGEVVMTPPQPATDADELSVQRFITQAQNQLLKFEQNVDNHVHEFTARHQGDIQILRDAEAKFFPGYDDPKHPSASIQKNVIEALPASMRDHPVSRTLAKVTANNTFLQAQNRDLQKKLEIAEGKLKDRNNGQPTKSEFVSGAVQSSQMPSYSDFEKARGR
jgi:hypothetical protein